MTANRSTATAQGKINLHLAVGDVRPDGYHELTTVFQAVDLTERVTIEYVGDANSSGIRSLTVSGFDAHLVPTDSSNLAWRAVKNSMGLIPAVNPCRSTSTKAFR